MIFIIGLIIIILLAKYTDRFSLSDSQLVFALIAYTILSILLTSRSSSRKAMMDRFFNLEGMCDVKKDLPKRYTNTYQMEDYGTTGLKFDTRTSHEGLIDETAFGQEPIPYSVATRIVNNQKYNLSRENDDTHSVLPYFSPVSYKMAPELIMESKMVVLEDEQALTQNVYNPNIGKDRGYLSWTKLF